MPDPSLPKSMFDLPVQKLREAASSCLMLFCCCPCLTLFLYHDYTRTQKEKKINEERERLIRKVDRRGPSPDSGLRPNIVLQMLTMRASSLKKNRHKNHDMPKEPWGHKDSALLTKLPAEIRFRIYELAGLDFDAVHVTKYREEDRAYGIRCSKERLVNWPDGDMEDSCRCLAGTRQLYTTRHGCVITCGARWVPPDPGLGILGLMLVCRFMYTDISTLLYSHKTLHFAWPSSLLLFTHTLAPHLRAQIAHIRIGNTYEAEDLDLIDMFGRHWHSQKPLQQVKDVENERYGKLMTASGWADTCAQLSVLPGLKTVRVTLKAQTVRHILNAVEAREAWDVHGSEEAIMKPLAEAARELGRDVNFKVIVDWSRGPDDRDWVDGAFDLERTPKCLTCRALGQQRCFSHYPGRSNVEGSA